MENFSVLLRIKQLRKVLVFSKEGNSIAFMNANVAAVASCVRTRPFLEMPIWLNKVESVSTSSLHCST